MDPRPNLIQIGDRIINVDHIAFAELMEGSASTLRVVLSVPNGAHPKEIAFQGDEARKLWIELQKRTTRQ